MLVGVDSLLYLFVMAMALANIRLSAWQHGAQPAALGGLIDKPRLFAGLALVFCLGLGLELLLFCWNHRLIEFDAEAGSLVVSVLWLQGEPMYHGLASAQRTALLYGPVTFLAYALPMWVDPSLLVARLTSAGALVGALIISNRLVAMVCSNEVTHRRLQAWGLALLLPFGAVLYTSRADALLLLCMACATTSAIKGRAVLTGVLAGLAIGLKVSAVLYVLPLLVLLQMRRTPFSTIALGCIVAMVTIIVPFALPGIDARHYADWLSEATRHGLQRDILLPNLLWLMAAAMPMLGVFGRLEGRTKTIAVSLGLCAVMAALMAGKAGAGAYHLIPFLPLYLWLLGQPVKANGQPIQMAHGVAMLVTSPVVLATFVLNALFLLPAVGVGETKTSSAVLEELRRVHEQNPESRVAIGYGQLQHRQSNAVVHSALWGGPVLMTDVAMWDMHAAGRKLPVSTLDALAACDDTLWLIPKGDVPFRSTSLYQRHGQADLFAGAEVAFVAQHQLTATMDYFDVYKCAS